MDANTYVRVTDDENPFYGWEGYVIGRTPGASPCKMEARLSVLVPGLPTPLSFKAGQLKTLRPEEVSLDLRGALRSSFPTRWFAP